ncbi:hypothetical protein LTR78_008544 [Recurvomyces mirabilis]|uniref:Uncharacterized protein n=1 Tax=Recurvomyces mirabilis TaxID=574656 RepID=A0AAE0TR92_9PEZI|nr:hypothetical protein LTR78_008544 [Recurvomyces mirabilis]KAK5156295.1 hypothetical protein LTS14_005183 [Recurvomyces mirabilis]
MPQPYLVHTSSHPVRVPHSTWIQWYTEEHIRDMVYTRAVKTACFYRATSHVVRTPIIPEDDNEVLALARIPSATPPDGNDFKQFLAVYQTDKKDFLNHAEYRDRVRLTTSLWEGTSSCHDVGSFTSSDLQLMDAIHDEHMDKDEPATHIIHCKITGNHFPRTLLQDLTSSAGKIHGYRRTLLYKPLATHVPPGDVNGNGVVNGVTTDATAPENTGPFMIMIHEYNSTVDVQGLATLSGVLEGSNDGISIAIRPFELLESEGYGGKVRKPERLPAD